MDREETRLKKIFADPQKTLRYRVLRAFDRSPESFLDEAQALELIIDLRRKLEISKFG